jgi:hypothetical protein
MRHVGMHLPTVRVARGGTETEGAARGRPVPWVAWSRAWLGVVGLAFVNGVLHRGYEGALGELRADQVSNLLLLLLVAGWAARTERRHHLATARDAVAVGVLWAVATVSFEFLFGHYVNGDAWADLFGAYDLLEGRLWPLAVVGVAATPLAARGWRLGSRRRIDAGSRLSTTTPKSGRPR